MTVNAQVTTADGYILSLQRIPGGRGSGPLAAGSKIPVLLQHGLLMVNILIKLHQSNLQDVSVVVTINECN